MVRKKHTIACRDLERNSRQANRWWLAMAFAFLSIFCCAPNTAADVQTISPSEWTGHPAWSPDGKTLAISWPAPQRVQMSKNPAKPILGTRANYDQRRLVLLDSVTYQRKKISFATDLWYPKWSPSGQYLAGVSSCPAKFIVYDAKSGHRCFECEAGYLCQFAWDADRARVAFSKEEGICILDVADSRTTMPIAGISRVRSVVWQPHGNLIAACGSFSDKDYGLVVFDATTGKSVLKSIGELTIEDAAWSSDGRWFAYGNDRLHILDGTSMKEVAVIGDEESNTAVRVSWSPNGKYLAYRVSDLSLHILNIENMSDISKIAAEKTGRFWVVWSPDSAYLLIDDGFGRLAICDPLRGKYIGSKQVDSIDRIIWDPDGQLLLGRDGYESIILQKLKRLNGVIVAPAFENGKEQNPWQDQQVPSNLTDCFALLGSYFKKEDLEQFKNTKESELDKYDEFGPSLGMQIRNMWGLREHTPLVKYFNSLGVIDGRDMSWIITVCYWRHLNGKTIGLEQQIKSLKDRHDPPVTKTPLSKVKRRGTTKNAT